MLNRSCRRLFETDAFGTSAVHLAVKACNIEWLTLLLSRGANVNATTNSLQTPLHWLVTEQVFDLNVVFFSSF